MVMQSFFPRFLPPKQLKIHKYCGSISFLSSPLWLKTSQIFRHMANIFAFGDMASDQRQRCLFSTTICSPPRIYPSLPEYTPLSTTICERPRIYPFLPEYTPLFNNYNIMRPSQNLPLPPRIYPPFQQLYEYAMLQESTPPTQNIPVTLLFNKHSTLFLCRVNADPASTTLAQH